MVDNLDAEVIRRLAAELLRRQPAVFADLVNGELPDEPQPGVEHPQPDPYQPQPAEAPQPAAEVPQPAAEVPQPDPEAPQPPVDGPPGWCHCGHCRVMPTQAGNKCCCQRRSQCTSTLDVF